MGFRIFAESHPVAASLYSWHLTFGAMLGLCSASALLQTLYCFRTSYSELMRPLDTAQEIIQKIHVSTGLYASSSGWAASLVDEFTRWGFPVLLLSWPVCWSASSAPYFLLLPGVSISNPSRWYFSPGPCTTNLAVTFLYSHHLELPLNLSLSLHLSLLCLIASGQRCIFHTSIPMLRWHARCLASAL